MKKVTLTGKEIFRKIRYKTGHIITHRDGKKYEVQKNGSWRKINTQKGEIKCLKNSLLK